MRHAQHGAQGSEGAQGLAAALAAHGKHLHPAASRRTSHEQHVVAAAELRRLLLAGHYSLRPKRVQVVKLHHGPQTQTAHGGFPLRPSTARPSVSTRPSAARAPPLGGGGAGGGARRITPRAAPCAAEASPVLLDTPLCRHALFCTGCVIGLQCQSFQASSCIVAFCTVSDTSSLRCGFREREANPEGSAEGSEAARVAAPCEREVPLCGVDSEFCF